MQEEIIRNWEFHGLGPKTPIQIGRGEKQVTVWCHTPKKWNEYSPVIFVMHGVKRNARKYHHAWIGHAERHNFLLLVPEFSQQHYPGRRGYNLGNILSPSGNPHAEDKWAYTAIEELFDAVQTIMVFRTNTYRIYGHSAGAQFVHRLTLFLPDARIDTAICANAGWYTFPWYANRFPYGLMDSGITEADLKKAFGKRVIVLLGDNDTNPHHKYLKQSTLAKRQGANRYERGINFYQAAKREAARLQVPLNWELRIVPGVGHHHRKMATAAVNNGWIA